MEVVAGCEPDHHCFNEGEIKAVQVIRFVEPAESTGYGDEKGIPMLMSNSPSANYDEHITKPPEG